MKSKYSSKTHIEIDGQTFNAGEIIETDDATAERLGLDKVTSVTEPRQDNYKPKEKDSDDSNSEQGQNSNPNARRDEIARLILQRAEEYAKSLSKTVGELLPEELDVLNEAPDVKALRDEADTL